MSKGQQRRREARKRGMRVIPGGAPLADRPEYKAHMAGWMAAGCPRPGQGPRLS